MGGVVTTFDEWGNGTVEDLSQKNTHKTAVSPSSSLVGLQLIHLVLAVVYLTTSTPSCPSLSNCMTEFVFGSSQHNFIHCVIWT